MQQTPIRRRPRLNTTVASDSLILLYQVAQETGLPNVGVALDYIVTDWKKLKRAAVETASPQSEPAR